MGRVGELVPGELELIHATDLGTPASPGGLQRSFDGLTFLPGGGREGRHTQGTPCAGVWRAASYEGNLPEYSNPGDMILNNGYIIYNDEIIKTSLLKERSRHSTLGLNRRVFCLFLSKVKGT